MINNKYTIICNTNNIYIICKAACTEGSITGWLMCESDAALQFYIKQPVETLHGIRD